MCYLFCPQKSLREVNTTFKKNIKTSLFFFHVNSKFRKLSQLSGLYSTPCCVHWTQVSRSCWVYEVVDVYEVLSSSPEPIAHRLQLRLNFNQWPVMHAKFSHWHRIVLILKVYSPTKWCHTFILFIFIS